MHGQKQNVLTRVYSNPQTDEAACIRREITRLLLAVGVPAQLNGYQYLREAIFMTLQSVEYISSVTKRLYPSLADQFGVAENSLNMDTAFIEDLGADSLDLVELMMSIEEEFDIGEIDEAEAASMKTIGDLVRRIGEDD